MKKLTLSFFLFSTLTLAQDYGFEKSFSLPDGNLAFMAPNFKGLSINADDKSLGLYCALSGLKLISFESQAWAEAPIMSATEEGLGQVTGGYPTSLLTCGTQTENINFDFQYKEILTREDGTKEFMEPRLSGIPLNADDILPKLVCEKMGFVFLSYTNITTQTEGPIVSGNSQGSYLSRSGYPLLSLICQ